MTYEDILHCSETKIKKASIDETVWNLLEGTHLQPGILTRNLVAVLSYNLS